MIDMCPVGALTSKPFRYSARTWELSRRKSISPHDSVGANLVVQVKNNQVMRVCRGKRSHQRMLDLGQGPLLVRSAEQRRTPHAAPMIKQGGKWRDRLANRAGIRGDGSSASRASSARIDRLRWLRRIAPSKNCTC
jgi:NADH-quinone oxidoreductase subunit G